jgi:hypothetical protein
MDSKRPSTPKSPIKPASQTQKYNKSYEHSPYVYGADSKMSEQVTTASQRSDG